PALRARSGSSVSPSPPPARRVRWCREQAETAAGFSWRLLKHPIQRQPEYQRALSVRRTDAAGGAEHRIICTCKGAPGYQATMGKVVVAARFCLDGEAIADVVTQPQRPAFLAHGKAAEEGFGTRVGYPADGVHKGPGQVRHQLAETVT